MTYKKHFTLAEARKTLPLVKKIVADILRLGKKIRQLSNQIDDLPEENLQLKRLIHQFNQYLAELEQLGCLYKDWNFDIGLVDFPAIIDGEEVFLCWRSDEESITWYHSLNSGYAGRRKIPSIE